MSTRSFNALIVFLVCGMVSYLIYSGSLPLFIHPRYFLFTKSFVYGGTFFAILAFLHFMTEEVADEGKKLRLQLYSVTPMLLIVIFGSLYSFRPLSSATLGQRANEINFLQSDSLDLFELFKRPSIELGLQEWIFMFQKQPDYSTFEGEQVSIEGFIYHDDKIDSSQFLLAKFLISCCSVDARPLGIYVIEDGWDDDLEIDQWVRVEGRLSYDEASNSILVVPDKIVKIDIPDDPYIY